MQVSVRLAQFHNNVKKLVREACENALKAEGFAPDPIDLGNSSILTLQMFDRFFVNRCKFCTHGFRWQANIIRYQRETNLHNASQQEISLSTINQVN